MNVKTIDGRDYLETYLAKIDNNTIDASGFFMDIKLAIKEILDGYNRKHKTSLSFIPRNIYGGNLQSIVNRFSGDYFSPSFLKSYTTNPALCLYEQTIDHEDVNAATAIGTTFHSIMETYYNLPAEERTREKLWKLEEELMREGQNKATLDAYVQGFIDSGDYLGGDMDDKSLECKTEYSGKCTIHVKDLDYTLPCDTSFIADRIDFRKDGTFIVDYKTGHPTQDAVTFDGYLGSMILYKWAVEQEMNIKIDGAYLMTPGNSDKFMELDMSIENQKILVEKIEAFFKEVNAARKRRIYSYTDKGYFYSQENKDFQKVMNDPTIWYARLPILLYIGDHADAEN